MQIVVSPFPTYADAIASIARDELDGQGTEQRIDIVSRLFDLDPSTVRYEVGEMVIDLKAAA